MKSLESAPNYLLKSFRLNDDGSVRWLNAEEVKQTGERMKRVPYGMTAGGRLVSGRGALIRYSGRSLLTSDVALALSLGDDAAFWFNYGGSPPDGEPSEHDRDDLQTIREMFTEWMGDLLWKISPHSTIPEGALVGGTRLSGRGDAAVSVHGRMYVTTDIMHALEHGRLPW